MKIPKKSLTKNSSSSSSPNGSSILLSFPVILCLGTILFGCFHLSMLYACNPKALLLFTDWMGITNDTHGIYSSLPENDNVLLSSSSSSSFHPSSFSSSTVYSSADTLDIDDRTLSTLQKQAKQLLNSIVYLKSLKNNGNHKDAKRSLSSTKAVLTEIDVRKKAFILSKAIINKIKHKNTIDTDKWLSELIDNESNDPFSSSSSSLTIGDGEDTPSATPMDLTAFRQEYPFHTQQTCYVQSDESEFCTYDGIFCFDGVSPIVIVDKPSLVAANTGGSSPIHDKTDKCIDVRFNEPTAPDDGGCFFDYKNNGERSSPHMLMTDTPDENDENDPSSFAFLTTLPTDTSLSIRQHRWGPLNRGPVHYREMTLEDVHYGGDPFHISLTDEQRDTFKVTKTLSPDADDSTNDIDTDNLHNLPKLRSIRRTESVRDKNFIIDWVDDPLWIVGLEQGSATVNPYVWMTHMGGLFDGQRSNSSGKEFGSHSMDSTPLVMGRGAFGSKSTTLFYKDAPFPRKLLEETGNSGSRFRDVVDKVNQQKQFSASSTDKKDTTTNNNNNPKTGKDTLKVPSAQSKVHNPNNYLKWLVGAQWDVPSMDYLFFTGPGSDEITNIQTLGDWYKRTLLLSIQSPVTKVYFKDAKSIVNSKHLVCSTKGGAVPGQKYHFFNGRGDASLYRQYSYIISGLAERHIRPHPLYPPRKITVFDSTGPHAGGGFLNPEILLKSIQSTGLPYEIIPDIDELSFDSIVELMSGTGVLIAPHGAHLAKTVPFLPSHSVVIDCFPYLTKNIVFQRIANYFDLHYFPLFSLESLSSLAQTIDNFNDLVTKYPAIQMEQQRLFWDKCLSKNITSYESRGMKECTQVVQAYPVYLDSVRLDRVMRDAVDGIAAYSTRNPAWKKIIQDEGIVAPSPPPWITQDKP